MTATLTRNDTHRVLQGAPIDFIVNGTDFGTATNFNASGASVDDLQSSQFSQRRPAAAQYCAASGQLSWCWRSFPALRSAPTRMRAPALHDFYRHRSRAPTITSGNSTTFHGHGVTAFSVTTTGTPAPALTETGALPTGVTFVDNGNGTATLAGTPASGTVNPYPHHHHGEQWSQSRTLRSPSPSL